MGDRPQGFEEVSSFVARSVIAIAVGTTLDDKPNIIGTGFAVEWPECFATCWHVAEKQDELGKLSKEALQKNFKLVDTKLRIACKTKEDTHSWRELEEKTWLCVSGKKDDICIYRAIGVLAPPLELFHEDDYPWGSEVGVIGFPMGNILQGKVIRPFWSKTIIAGGFEMRLEGGKETFRLALDSSFAGGFSGSPVFLAANGQVVGMIGSDVRSCDERGQMWPAGISLAVPASLISRVLREGMDRTTEMIKDGLRMISGGT